jgi:two-component system sensor histidine kinase/response regulator
MITNETIFLVVDDADTMRKINTSQLELLGGRKFLLANNGLEALAILRSRRVNVIISDWNMPVMDGLELLREVRRDPQLAHLPFIMITAECARAQIADAIAAGVSSILIKPYTAQELAQHMARAMQHRPRQQVASVSAKTPSRGPAGTPDKRPTLLVVDDVPDNLTLIAGLFMQDYRVRVAQDGRTALAICTSNSPPDLLLLDVMMPNMDGFELAQHLRCHPQASKIPLVFITAVSDPSAQIRALELGAVNFVSKPIDPDVLRLRVVNLLRHVEVRKNLQADYDNMLELARLREEVAHISRHDLKAPLCGMLGLTQGLLGGGNLLARQTDMLQLLEDNCRQALDMLNLSAELYKIETGRFQLQAENVEVLPLLRRLVETARITYEAKNLVIELLVRDGLELRPPMARGDALLCYSLLNNLLKNACEAAPIGTRVRIALDDAQPLSISLENQPAVPEQFRAQFFDKHATFGKAGGSGLGTYSAKLLAQAQHGSLELEVDAAADITRLHLCLPRAEAPKASAITRLEVVPA